MTLALPTPRPPLNVRRGRGGRPYRRVKAAVLTDWFARALPCWWCGHDLDEQLTRQDPRHRWAATVDHIVALTRGGDPLDPANMFVAHLRCNSQRGDGTNQISAEITSRLW